MSRKALNIIQFQNKINRPLILDGAVGSILQQRNISNHKILWSSYANIIASEKVIEVHKEYINAGADIITTNTFRTNPIVFKQAKLKITNFEFVQKSIALALQAVGENKNVLIAGSNPPAEDSYQKFRNFSKIEIIENHKNHIDMLWESKVDFILNETQSHFDEIKIICEHCSANNIPFVISFFVTNEGKILSGEPIKPILDFVESFNPIAVGINCVSNNTFSKIVSEINFNKRWGFYLNCGSGKYTDKKILEGVTPFGYVNIVKKYSNKNPFFIGTCCGSSPKHTEAIKEFILGQI